LMLWPMLHGRVLPRFVKGLMQLGLEQHCVQALGCCSTHTCSIDRLSVCWLIDLSAAAAVL
jgi:hypothetical protein